jgi:PTS system ascorbate-specific IIA component
VEKVLDRWGWGSYVSVEATDTVSAKGKAKEADLIVTSGEIGRALGDLGVPMQIIEDFTSAKEVDAALRASYDV